MSPRAKNRFGAHDKRRRFRKDISDIGLQRGYRITTRRLRAFFWCESGVVGGIRGIGGNNKGSLALVSDLFSAPNGNGHANQTRPSTGTRNGAEKQASYQRVNVCKVPGWGRSRPPGTHESRMQGCREAWKHGGLFASSQDPGS